MGYEKNDIHFMHSDRFAFGLLTIRNARQYVGAFGAFDGMGLAVGIVDKGLFVLPFDLMALYLSK